jgi:hypothetical protein
MKTCSTCRYWDPEGKVSEDIACRRYPPTTTQQERQTDKGKVKLIITIWPLTTSTDWCGEWMEKIENGNQENSSGPGNSAKHW